MSALRVGELLAGLAALVLAMVIVVVVTATRGERLCECGHPRHGHNQLSLMGIPCRQCRTCAVFTPARRFR